LEWEKIRSLVLQKIEPSYEEEQNIKNFSESLLKKVNKVIKESGIKAKAELHGSVAHGTWISESQDLDVFIVLQEYKRELLTDVLNIIKKGIEGNFTEAYAEHPYLQSLIDGFTVDFVPCFSTSTDKKILSSTDRTPLHTEYLNKNLNKEKKEEVRLLKQFIKGIRVYGAEIKVQGFSGYLCELLIIRYGAFWSLLKATKNWTHGTTITLTTKPIEKFHDPLVFIDPVDPKRNVASALSEENFWTFIYAAELFIEKPNISFFFPEKERVSSDELLKKINVRNTDMVFLVIDETKNLVDDTLWGMLNKSKQGIEKALIDGGFNVLRTSVWNNKNKHIFIFELDEAVIPKVVKHLGPPGNFRKSSKSFIEVHLSSNDTVSGPGIKNNRWYILKNRKYVNVVEFLNYNLIDGGVGMGVSRNLATSITRNYKILINNEIRECLTKEFVSYLNMFFKGRPHWIEQLNKN
jgi:tRNA nucleotidyltransferase (CCA-adding enzyme)